MKIKIDFGNNLRQKLVNSTYQNQNQIRIQNQKQKARRQNSIGTSRELDSSSLGTSHITSVSNQVEVELRSTNTNPRRGRQANEQNAQYRITQLHSAH